VFHPPPPPCFNGVSIEASRLDLILVWLGSSSKFGSARLFPKLGLDWQLTQLFLRLSWNGSQLG
jgi:hypothetical protein